MFDRRPVVVPGMSYHLSTGRPTTRSRRRPVDVPVKNFWISVLPVKSRNKHVIQRLLLLKNNFFIKSSIFVFVPWRFWTLRPLGNLQGRFPGRRAPAGFMVILKFFSQRFFLKDYLMHKQYQSLKRIWFCSAYFAKIHKVFKVNIWWMIKCDLLKFSFVWNFCNKIA